MVVLVLVFCVILSFDQYFELLVNKAYVYALNRIKYSIIIIILFVYFSLLPETTSNDAPKRRKKSTLVSAWMTVERTAERMLEWMIQQTDHWGRRQRGRTSSPTLTHRKVGWSSKLLRMYVAAVVAMAAGARASSIAESDPFDTDSAVVGIDNRCSGCITHVRTDIPGELRECKRVVKGFGGERQFRVWTGTIHWSWEDDYGRSHDFVIPNSYYIPDGKVRLLSPQHYAQSQRGSDRRGGAGETTTGTQTVLFWGNRQYQRTVPIDRHSSNVASFRLSAGYTKFHAYCAQAELTDHQAYDADPVVQDDLLIVDDTALVSDDEGDTDAVEESNRSGFPMHNGGEQDQEDTHTLLQLDGPDGTEDQCPCSFIDGWSHGTRTDDGGPAC